ncbi:hypothetical protein EJD97_004187 [Solanum chilense]|uniref:Bifunctional inhibitor/plant lipid transfer protein/seed storage helical domain-containing protein n=1 Tax=Solanum chilense TaxID=4083 RepID=A0A6N2BV18_SOLCI|nr:hypothetical protein EJD97_004187 [Solanum chilense]
MRLSSSTFSLVAILIISLLLSRPYSSDGAVKCKEIAQRIKPCIDWMSIGYKSTGIVPKTCCNEIFRLNGMGVNREAELAICECFKSEMQDLNIDDKVSISISGRCGVLLPFPIVPNVNCSEI